ncbi:MAG: hypothetical protein ABJB01_00330 [Rudaea sp.]
MKTNLFAPFTLSLLAFAVSAHAQDSMSQHTDRNGNTTTIRSGQPAPVNYGPAPSFEQLDADRSGTVSRDEASAYPPLLNDFDFIAHHVNTISRKQYERWNASQNRQ